MPQKLAELRARQRLAAVAARKEELRRRREAATRLVEVGLGAQLRFAAAADALGLEGDEDVAEETASEQGDEDGHAGDEPPPLTIG